MHRKFCASLAAAIVAFVTFATPGFAQKYPDRPIRVIIPLPPGGSVDIVARLLQPLLEKSLGQSLVIDNRSGASGIIGANAVATAPPDGYTLLLAPTTFSITAALHPKLPFDPLRAFQPVTVRRPERAACAGQSQGRGHEPAGVRGARQSQPQHAELLHAGRIEPGASAVRAVEPAGRHQDAARPYRGGAPALMAAVTGETQVTLISSSVALPQIEAKALRALATGGASREAKLPDVPTTAEAGFPHFQASQWVGLLATGGTPREVIERLNAEINRALEDKGLQTGFAEQGLSAAGGSPEEFRALLEGEIRQWKDVARASNIEMQ